MKRFLILLLLFFNSNAIVSVAANAPATVSQTNDSSDEKLSYFVGESFYVLGYMYGATLLKIDDLEHIPITKETMNSVYKRYEEFLKKIPSESAFYSVLNSISTREDVIRQLDWEAISKSSTKSDFPIYAIFSAGVLDGVTQFISPYLLQGNSVASDEFDYINSDDPKKMQNRVDELFRIAANWFLSTLSEFI